MYKLIMLIVLISLSFPGSVLSSPTPKQPNSGLTFDQLAEMTKKYDTFYDQIEVFPKIRTPDDITQWVKEVVPYFSYEMITDPESEYGTYSGPRFPENISFTYYEDERQHSHILGTANCLSQSITLNGRYANENSAFYERNDLLVILVHELAHIQGICYGSSRLDSEISAQLATLEVLAALVNHGNKQALGPLLGELRKMSLNAALYMAYEEERIDDFLSLVTTIVDSPYEQARLAKSARYWVVDKEHESYILYTYNYRPILEVEMARWNDRCSYIHIYWSKEIDDIVREPVGVDSPCINGVYMPINRGVFQLPLFIDDLDYVMIHMAELVSATEVT